MLGGDREPDKKLVVRLQSADDLPGLPLDCVLATEAFAAQAKFDLGEKILLVPVGRAEIAPAAEDGERQAMRSRPSLPIYTAEWAEGRRAKCCGNLRPRPVARPLTGQLSRNPIGSPALSIDRTFQCPSPLSISTVR